MTPARPTLGCAYCAVPGGEPGYIELDNGGGTYPCPFCNHETDYDRAERQRAERAKEKALPRESK